MSRKRGLLFKTMKSQRSGEYNTFLNPSAPMLGRTYSEEAKFKLRDAALGRKY